MDEHRGLWRGKRINGEWAFGCLVRSNTKTMILVYDDDTYKMTGTDVISYTLGECTGLRDKFGKLIFEGDICKFQNVFNTISGEPHIGTVRYYSGAKPISDSGKNSVDIAECNPEDLEVLGNIHDNPEILKGGKDE